MSLSALQVSDRHRAVPFSTMESAPSSEADATIASSRNASTYAQQQEWECREFTTPVPGSWRGALGAALPGEVLRARLEGPAHAPVVIVLGGISAHRAPADARDGSLTGWWRGFTAPDGGVDTRAYRIFSMDFAPEAPEAPLALTTDDHAQLLAMALDAAGLDHVHALVGASFGGCVGLAFAARFPERLERLCVISAAHRPHPTATALRGVQRRILDFAAATGNPEEGVALARQIAMVSYRSPEEFGDRFEPGLTGASDTSEACSYLVARGAAHANTMAAARYATLSASLDRHDVRPEDIRTPTLLMGVENDQLIPIADMEDLAQRLGGPAQLERLSCLCGHDSFLKDAPRFAPALRAFLAT